MKIEKCSECGEKADPTGAGPFTGSSDMCKKHRAEYVSGCINTSIRSGQKKVFIKLLRNLSKGEIISIVAGIIK